MTDELDDAVRQIVELAKESRRTTWEKAEFEPRGHYYLFGADGKAELKKAAPEWHGEQLDTPTDLADFIDKAGVENGATFIAQDRIVFVYDLADRRDTASCLLPLSPQYKWLASPPQQMTQADFVRVLRITFRGCLASDNLLTMIRELRFDGTTAANGTIQQGRESMGRQITNAVTGASAIPEETAMIVPVFENHPFKTKITCALECFPAECTFRLTPYPLEVRAAIDLAISDIAKTVGGENRPPVHRGKP